MCGPKDFWHTGIILVAFAASIGQAGEVKSFVPRKPWQVTIDLNEFEPWDLLGDKTILGGRTNDGITITIIVEDTKVGTKPDKIRKVYGYKTASKFGKKETIEEIDVNNIAIIVYKWSEKNIPDGLNEPQAERAKDAIKDKWGYHGYTVKDDIAFDIHLSADMTKRTKKQMLDIIESFQIKPSTKLEECKKIHESLDENIRNEEKEKLLRQFIKKYPSNPEPWFLLAEQLENLKEKQSAYLKALDNHKIQPLIDPVTLLKCKVGLGMCYAISREYDLAKQHLESGYNLGKKIEMPPITAWSAYVLACVFAKTNDTQNSVKYLAESIKLTPRYKEKAKHDSSFDNIRGDRRFRNIVGR
jgi:tetratricopeptide (TPR) repeat protein